MSNDEIEKSEKHPIKDSGKEIIIKGERDTGLYSDRPINEGYQPSDKLDTSNPPVDQGLKNEK